MKGSIALPIAFVLVALLASCGRDPSEVEVAERSRIVASYERLLREREVEWVRTAGRGMATVLALRVAPDAHDTARTALAIIVDDILVRGDADGIKALAVLLEADGMASRQPEPYVAAWVDEIHIVRELRGSPPAEVIADLLTEELVFEVAGSTDNRRITLRLYYTMDQLDESLAERRNREGLPPARR